MGVYDMHTIPSNNKRKTKQQRRAILRKNGISGFKLDEHNVVREIKTKKTLVSTLTHTTREVAEHFLKWRDNLKKTMLGHNGGPKIDD